MRREASAGLYFEQLSSLRRTGLMAYGNYVAPEKADGEMAL